MEFIFFALGVVIIYCAIIFILSWIVGYLASKFGVNQKACKAAVVFSIISATAIAVYFINPLPSDEKMILNFQKNKELFNKMADEYSNFDGGYGDWHIEKRVEMNDLGVGSIQVWGPYWLENPYSIESGYRVKNIESSLALNKKFINSERRHKALRFMLAKGRHNWSPRYLRSVWKSYLYFPVVPRVENGYLFYPVNEKGVSLGRDRVLPTLDRYPESWSVYECVLKKINDHWFLQMCRA